MVHLAGYTALTETHGDEHATELAVGFASLAAGCLGDGDRLIKPIGDVVLLASPTPKAGIALVSRLLESTTRLEGLPARAGPLRSATGRTLSRCTRSNWVRNGRKATSTPCVRCG